MSTATQYAGGGGQSSSFAINYGGATPSNPTNSAATEEWTTDHVIKTVTTS